MNKRVRDLIIYFIAIFVVLGCESGIDKDILINKAIKRKLDRHIERKLDKCRTNALEDAEIYVDSIIKEVTKSAIGSDIDFPDKPMGRDTSNKAFDISIDSVEMVEIVESLKINSDSFIKDSLQIIDTIK